ncbi:MAG: DUF1592 domain-containing protein, partial [Planctomycetaceae bacterium]|nr:DUF1592 domain-containing protein [Planctomycetaceae bacterium]
THRRQLNRGVLYTAGEEVPEGTRPELILPSDPTAQELHLQALMEFCAVFPDAFYVSERGRDYLNVPRDQQEKGRLLSAGFHSMMGYFRDDAPLCELILEPDDKATLDRLWQELDYVADAPLRQYLGFLWFERTDSKYMRDPEFDFARPENRGAASEPMIRRLSELYLAKARRNGGEGVALQAIDDYFERINRQIRWVESARTASEPLHCEQLLAFARRAWRRPLDPDERDEILSSYRTLRDETGLTHEAAIRECLAGLLVSPHFLYRVDLIRSGAEPRPLNDFELANRLSSFLWASCPDDPLLRMIESDEERLSDEDVLLAETQRMLADSRIRGLAVEFGTNWLDVRRFEEHNSVDRERFPEFTDELRTSMWEEPIRFLSDLVQNDRSVLELLAGKHTFVNDVLAQHYGMNELDISAGEWVRIEDAREFGRGGLLPMAVFLTKNSPGLRTSPVKRGYWVVRQLLGERIPPPPPNVPELPADESQLGELTLREVLARHREHASCAGCHNRFDGMGLSFEGYGPVGERRSIDLGGRPVQVQAEFPGGQAGAGIDGLRDYLTQHRQAEFVDNLCRKLLSYALGRTLLLSDEPLIAKMKERLQEDEYRFQSLIESIVVSPQFRTKRGEDDFAGQN